MKPRYEFNEKVIFIEDNSWYTIHNWKEINQINYYFIRKLKDNSPIYNWIEQNKLMTLKQLRKQKLKVLKTSTIIRTKF